MGPASCTSVPYATNLTVDDIETMYPYINPLVGGTGMAQANLHTLDTISAISDLYPGPGWPAAYGTISGKVFDLNGKTELTGVNVIARNVADPFADSVSALTGQMTQGQLGPRRQLHPAWTEARREVRYLPRRRDGGWFPHTAAVVPARAGKVLCLSEHDPGIGPVPL